LDFIVILLRRYQRRHRRMTITEDVSGSDKTHPVRAIASAFAAWLRQRPIVHGFVLFLGTTVVVSGAMAFLIMVGAVQFADKAEKNRWLEPLFQILNGIFSLATLIDQPRRIRGFIATTRFWSTQSDLYTTLETKTRKSHHLRDCRVALESLQALFPWFGVGALKQEDTGASDDTLDVTAESKALQHNLLELDPRPLWTAMFVWQISTASQAVVSYTMWTYHPIDQRPFLPVAIFTPLSFLADFSTLFYLWRQGAKKHVSVATLPAVVVATSTINPSEIV
jgi:hypothetical protein